MGYSPTNQKPATIKGPSTLVKLDTRAIKIPEKEGRKCKWKQTAKHWNPRSIQPRQHRVFRWTHASQVIEAQRLSCSIVPNRSATAYHPKGRISVALRNLEFPVTAPTTTDNNSFRQPRSCPSTEMAWSKDSLSRWSPNRGDWSILGLCSSSPCCP